MKKKDKSIRSTSLEVNQPLKNRRLSSQIQNDSKSQLIKEEDEDLVSQISKISKLSGMIPAITKNGPSENASSSLPKVINKEQKVVNKYQ